MAEHKHGSMEIATHERTFSGFIGFVKWGIILSFAVLIFIGLVNA
jgi:Bacterial aa3 type cytochrome c oxidase subunit IV